MTENDNFLFDEHSLKDRAARAAVAGGMILSAVLIKTASRLEQSGHHTSAELPSRLAGLSLSGGLALGHGVSGNEIKGTVAGYKTLADASANLLRNNPS
jgi:hypothetical protein